MSSYIAGHLYAERKASMSEDPVHQIQLRVRGNPLGPVLQRYITYLVGRGYSVSILREYVRIAEHFGSWRGRRSLSQAAVRQFLSQHLPVCRCSGPVSPYMGRCSGPVARNVGRNRRALNHLLVMCGMTTPAATEFPHGVAGDLLQRYARWLSKVRGLAVGTIRYRLKTAKTMLAHFRVTQCSQLAKWTPQQIVDFVSSEATRVKPSRAQNIACTVRSLLRYFLQEGLICRDLSAAVPTFAHWRLASLPETLQKEELVRLLQVPDVRTAVGLRDRAILLCLGEVGLRASDVAGLKLDGVNLASSALALYRNKPRKTTTLPMTHKLVRALDAYLRRGRPACKSPSVFVLHRPPVGRPLTPANVSDIAWRMGERANLRKQLRGAHVLRHTFASRMLHAGATLKQVADLLGHRSIDTTVIYAKVDFKTLSRVAMPWPGTKEGRR